jgi:hypothetical protein
MKISFTEHPASVNETYAQHMGMACSFAGPLFVGACACLVHAFLPFLFLKTGSSIIDRLHGRMVTGRVVRPARDGAEVVVDAPGLERT